MLSLKQIKQKNLKGEVDLPVSKSMENRMLVIKALNLSLDETAMPYGSGDTSILFAALTTTGAIDFQDAGTPLRLFLAYAALRGFDHLITGNERLKERPIRPLLEALESLGAEFTFLETTYQLPLKLSKPIDRNTSEVTIDANISSQFISALMLIGPYMQNGLEIRLKGELRSTPYLYLTQFCMEAANVYADIDEEEAIIFVEKGSYTIQKPFRLEADWSAAAFIYAWVAMSDTSSIFIPGLKRDSPQGDAIVAHLFSEFGVHSVFRPDGLLLSKKESTVDSPVFDVEDIPDCFPVLIALCAIKKLKAVFFGVANLRHKESDRILAMSENLKQCGAEIRMINEDSLELVFNDNKASTYSFKTYKDHRIAMACSLFAFEKDIELDDEKVVKKSFPLYWEIFREILYSG